MKGIFPSKLKISKQIEEYIEAEVPCEKTDNIGARQIFPLLKHPHWRTPTIKHGCIRTDLAATLRACSNKVTPDEKIFKSYAKWFEDVFQKEFLSFLDNEEVTVDLNKWLDKQPYTSRYKEKLLRNFQPARWTPGDSKLKYTSFTKCEMQHTTTIHDLKETELNDVKERKICAPTDEKKAMANAFINKLEEIADRYLDSYCGRCDWMQIAKKVENAMLRIRHIIFCAADGSGFDMSQLIQHNTLMNNLIKKCARHNNVVFNEPLTPDLVDRALDSSLVLSVSASNGDIQYEAQGRASGDGWTTFANTMLMISYYRFVLYQANIDPEHYFLLVKGDDVLLAMSECYKDVFERMHSRYFTSKKHVHSHGLGQICTEIKWGPLQEMDFLSNHFFFTGKDRVRITRIPARVFQTISWSTQLKSDGKMYKNQKELCFSKGMSLLSWAQGLPIFEKLGKKMVQLGVKGISDFNYYTEKCRQWHPRNDYDAYCSYLNQKYALTMKDVKDIEAKIDAIHSLSGVVNIPQLDLFYN